MFKKIFANKWGRLGMLLSLFVVYAVVATLLFGTACLISYVIGFPCPSCGMTRANLLFLTLNFKEAFMVHPLFFYSYILAGGLFLLTLKPKLIKSKTVQVIAIVLIVVYLVVYIVRMIYLFPHTEPMDFHHNSILGYILKWCGVDVF